MAESKIRDDNYYQVSGWMINRLGLKGTALQVYAIIYGFTQDSNQRFTGSRQYLADWTNTTQRGVQKALTNLVAAGLLDKKCTIADGVRLVSYRANMCPQGGEQSSRGVGNKVPEGREQSSRGVGNKVPEGREQSSHNNYIENKKDNKLDSYKYIVGFLNEKAGTRYKPTAKDTQEHINARLADGYTLEDFRTVIEKKCVEWMGTDFEKFLRPSTLFGRKFESYLNGKVSPPKKTAPADYGRPEDFYR